MDYRNTPEGRAVQNKYSKILHASRPEPPHNHPRMPMSNRAIIPLYPMYDPLSCFVSHGVILSVFCCLKYTTH